MIKLYWNYNEYLNVLNIYLVLGAKSSIFNSHNHTKRDQSLYLFLDFLETDIKTNKKI